MKYVVYIVTNEANNKKYVGVTNRKINIRFNEHMTHNTGLLYRARKKYGRKNLSIDILEKDILESDISDKEKYYIKLHNTLSPLGYNISNGGLINKSISEEGKQKLRRINIGLNNPMSKGKIEKIDPLTGEVLEIYDGVRDAARRMFNDSEKKANIAICLSGKTKTAYGFKWRYVD